MEMEVLLETGCQSFEIGENENGEVLSCLENDFLNCSESPSELRNFQKAPK